MIHTTTLDKLLKTNPNRSCVLCGGTPVQIHHSFIFGGKSVQDLWSLVFLCKSCHDKATPHNSAYQKEYEERAFLSALNKATDKELKKYSKIDCLIKKRARLNKKFPRETKV